MHCFNRHDAAQKRYLLRRRSKSGEQRYKRRPDAFRHDRGALRIRVTSVRLVERRVARHTLEKERHARHVVFTG